LILCGMSAQRAFALVVPNTKRAASAQQGDARQMVV
jgi:hypothetical protein